jgi:hypothetical protein
VAADEPTLDPQQTARIAAHGARDRGGHRWFLTAVIVLFVGLVAAGIGVVSLTGQQRQAATAAQLLEQQVRQYGGTPVVQAPAPIAGPVGATGATGVRGPGPSQAQIDGAVAAYFADHTPGATPAMVAVQVAAYLTAHPPQPGPAPTAEQIATAASDYIGAHAADFQGATGQNGTDGQDGQPGQNATDAQVTAAVTAYCDAHGQCQGATGVQGPPPAAWTWTDPGSGQAMTCTRNTDSPDSAPTYACAADSPTPPTTTTTPLLPIGG